MSMSLRNSVLAMTVALFCTGTTYAADEKAEVMKPVQNFFSAFARRDKAAMLAELAPNVEVMSARKGELRRLNIDALADLVVAYKGGAIAEPIHDPIIHIDDNLAVIWTRYEFTVEGRVNHCGTDVITLMKLNGRWVIVGLADNGRDECSQK
jgi:Putative lumazine-binding